MIGRSLEARNRAADLFEKYYPDEDPDNRIERYRKTGPKRSTQDIKKFAEEQIKERPELRPFLDAITEIEKREAAAVLMMDKVKWWSGLTIYLQRSSTELR